MHAEFIPTYEATRQAIWMKKFIPRLRVVHSIERPLRLYFDSERAIFYSYNNKLSGAASSLTLIMLLSRRYMITLLKLSILESARC